MLQRVLPPGIGIDPDSPGARDTLVAWYEVEKQNHLRLNLVTSIDGRAAGADGSSESLTTRTDRMLLGVIRQTADAVLVGGATVRAEHLRRPRRTPLVVLTASGDLSGHGFTASRSTEGVERASVLVVTSSAGAPHVARTLGDTEHDVVVLEDEVLESESERLDIAAVLTVLRERGLHRIVAEGGPSLAAQLLAENLVDELCLTIVPSIAGTGIPLFDGVAPATLSPTQVLIDDDGVIYGRWELSREP